MKSKINKGNLAVQQIGEGSNLGGPTSYPLGACVPIVNFDWVRKFIELNQEGTQ